MFPVVLSVLTVKPKQDLPFMAVCSLSVELIAYRFDTMQRFQARRFGRTSRNSEGSRWETERTHLLEINTS